MMVYPAVPRALLIGFAALFGCSSAAAAAETLSTAVRSAIEQHPSVEKAQAALDAAGQSKREEVSGYFPELSVATTGGRIYGDNSTSRGLSVSRGVGYSYLWEGSITARQMIFDGFETKNRVQSAAARRLSADMELASVREDLSYRAAQAYLDVMRARTGLNMLNGYAKKVSDYLGRIRTAVDEGASDEAELQQARDVKVILDGYIVDYEGQLRAAEAAYAEITGHFPGQDMQIPAPDAKQIPETMEQAIEQAKAAHPTMRAARLLSKSSAYDIKSEKSQLYPDLDGELSYLKSDKADVIGGEVVDARAVVRMNWALETGGAQLARIRRKKFEHREALSRVGEIERQIEQGVRLAYAEMNTAHSQIKNLVTRHELNQKLFETYGVQFEGSRISLLQLMQADNQLFNTELEKLNGEYRLLNAQFAVLASMGKLQNALILAAANTGPVTDGQN